MTAFIVISTDKRLSGLVDDIEKCLPLNPDVRTYLSTGKVEEQGDHSYKYTYQLHNEQKKDDEVYSFHDLVLNQVAAFRRISKADQLLHILILENPLKDDEFAVIDGWMSELEGVYREDSYIHIHRALFTYCIDDPCNVAKHIPNDILKLYLECREVYEFKDASDLMFIGNRNMWGASVSLKRGEHSLKMSRMLADFIMLISSDANSYGVFSAVLNLAEKCFTLGWAESMYYFPDVREYYEHADRKSFYDHILNEPDQTADFQKDMEAMDIEMYPIGLLPRRERLGVKYYDVPFDRDIGLYEDSADSVIDSCLLELKELVERKRDEEIQEKKAEIEKRKREIEEEIQSLQDEEDSGDEGYEYGEDEEVQDDEVSGDEESEEIKRLREKIEELDKEFEEFEPNCPEFISRKEIYDSFCAYDPNDEDEAEESGKYLKDAEDRYSKLLRYVTGKDFFSYLNTNANDHGGLPKNTDSSQENRSGCLGIFRRKKAIEEIPIPTPQVASSSPIENVKKIRQQLKLKIEFQNFLRKCEEIERKTGEEEKWCEDFKLTDHSNHYYHLINLEELREYQEKKFGERFENLLAKWNNEKPEDRTLTQLEKLLHEATIDYTYYYRFIDWSAPFDFVSDTDDKHPAGFSAIAGSTFAFVSDTDDKHLTMICNALHKLSSPYVHYETITGTAPNDIIIALYSDMPNIVNRFNSIRQDITDNTNVIPYHSTHIASKICYFQFLPLDKTALELLVKPLDDDTDPSHDNENLVINGANLVEN